MDILAINQMKIQVESVGTRLVQLMFSIIQLEKAKNEIHPIPNKIVLWLVLTF